uniref:Uncharacterized protein n=1 Tax=Trichogramma kaykai TaxID=54128 RepID=A0ABD2X4H6_9HYME
MRGSRVLRLANIDRLRYEQQWRASTCLLQFPNLHEAAASTAHGNCCEAARRRRRRRTVGHVTPPSQLRLSAYMCARVCTASRRCARGRSPSRHRCDIHENSRCERAPQRTTGSRRGFYSQFAFASPSWYVCSVGVYSLRWCLSFFFAQIYSIIAVVYS